MNEVPLYPDPNHPRRDERVDWRITQLQAQGPFCTSVERHKESTPPALSLFLLISLFLSLFLFLALSVYICPGA